MRILTLFFILPAILILVVSCRNTPETLSPFTSLTNAEIEASVNEVFRDTAVGVVRSRFARVNMDFFERERSQTGDSVVALQPFDNASLTMLIDRIADNGDGTISWSGRVDSSAYSMVSMVTTRDAVLAMIQIEGTVYDIQPAGNGIVRIREINQALLPDECKSGDSKLVEAPRLPEAQAGNTTIKILVILPYPYNVIYCTGPMGDVRKMLERKYTENLNSVFNFSAIPPSGVTASVVIECSSYKPVGMDLETDLAWLESDPGVEQLRTKHGADLVNMIVPSAKDLCGKGNRNPGLDSTNVYSVVVESCATSKYTLAHELGHTVGMAHERDESNSGDGSCRFASLVKIEFVDWDMTYKTVMFSGSSNATRIGVYSNPYSVDWNALKIKQMGIPCYAPPDNGKFARADNRQWLINAAPIVSNFR